ncbi:hypothetical protein D3C71_1891250 [compost metagenome]
MAARARVTSSLETPTRKLPVISLMQSIRLARSSCDQSLGNCSASTRGDSPRKGSSLSSIQAANPSLELWAASGSTSEMVSARSPTA